MFRTIASSAHKLHLHFIRNESGQMAYPAMGILLFGMLAGIGLIHDSGNVYYKKTVLQSVIDVSTISCGEQYLRNKTLTATDIENCLRDTFQYNGKLNGINVALCEENDPSPRYFVDLDNKKIGIRCSYPVEAKILGKFSGVSGVKAANEVSSSATYSLNAGGDPIIVAFVLDYSESMNSTEFALAHQAIKNGMEKLTVGDYVSISGYSGAYNGDWDKAAQTPFWKRAVALPMTAITSEEQKDDLHHMLDLITRAGWADYGSFAQGGLYFARQMIYNLKTKMDPDPIKSEAKYNSYKKIIIHIGDGKYNQSVSPTFVPPTGVSIPSGGKGCTSSDSSNLCNNHKTYGHREGSQNPYTGPDGYIRTWHERNSGLYDNEDDGTTVANPINQHVDPSHLGFANEIWWRWTPEDSNMTLNLHFRGECGDNSQLPKKRWAIPMAAREADLARHPADPDDYIEVISICSDCGNAAYATAMMRIAADPDLPSSWLSHMYDEGKLMWASEADYNELSAKQKNECAWYPSSNNHSLFNYTEDTKPKHAKKRYYRKNVNEFGEVFESLIGEFKGGKLVE